MPAVPGQTSQADPQPRYPETALPVADRVVSVWADGRGQGVVWRRLTDGTVERQERTCPAWLLCSRHDLVAHLPRAERPEDLWPDGLRRLADDSGGLPRVIELRSDRTAAYRYLVVAGSIQQAEAALLDAYGEGATPARSLAEMGPSVLCWPADEQLVLLDGLTSFGGMAYADLHRMQFDLETTGLDLFKDRIFMISLRDSSGWTACLDTSDLSEGEIIERFARILRERDPDVLENHNLFGFDLPFLVQRAAALGVSLALGRDGSAPTEAPDVHLFGGRSEPFTRWLVAGREVIDTQHAVKREGARSREVHRLGLKDAAVYYQLAKGTREYVPGAEVWPTFQRDPERIRRYGADDVDEVDMLSRHLMQDVFGLAKVVPRPYQRLATDGTGRGLLEPLLVRRYLQAGHAPPMPPTEERPFPGLRPRATFPRSTLAVGLFHDVVRVRAPGLLPTLMLQHGIAAAQDELGALPAVLQDLSHRTTAVATPLSGAPDEDRRAGEEGVRDGREEVRRACGRLLAAPTGHAQRHGTGGLFADPEAAAALASRAESAWARAVLPAGCTPLIRDADELWVARTRHGTTDREERRLAPRGGLGATPAEEKNIPLPGEGAGGGVQTLAEAIVSALPPGSGVRQVARYPTVYLNADGGCALLKEDGSVALLGPQLKNGQVERFGERFLRQAAGLALTGNHIGLRALYADVVNRLRRGEVDLLDLCRFATLHRSNEDYPHDGPFDEPYEVALCAGITTWPAGFRVRYFRGLGSTWRLYDESDAALVAKVDAEYYVGRLRSVYCEYLAGAFDPTEFATLFEVPAAVSHG